MSMSFSFFVKSGFKNYGFNKFTDDSFLTMVSGVAFLLASLSRFLWGTVQDHIGFKKVYAAILVMQIIAGFFIDHLADSKFFFCFFILMIFVCEGGHFVIFPTLATHLYGPT